MGSDFFHRLLIAPLPYVPRQIVWQLSRRYIAGTDLDSAYETVRGLNSEACSATIDVLGEDSTVEQQVRDARDLYIDALAGINRNGLDCNASVKLSELGLRFDQDQCLAVMRELLLKAADHGNFVRIDMEDSSVTSITLDVYRKLREEFGNVGTVIQSCLKRSEQDTSELLNAGCANLRLCKGIYVEPAKIAYTHASDIRRSYCDLLEQLVEGGAERVGIATHDPAIVEFALQLIEKHALPKERYEFQMLLGVAGRLRRGLVAAGHPLRVYVPFGERWYAYSMRRLRENPKIAGHIVRNLLPT